MKDPQTGEVYKVDLGYAGKVRFMIIVSRQDMNAPRALATGVPITSQYRDSQYEVEVGSLKFLTKKSYANVQGVQALMFHELNHCVGRIAPKTLDRIKEALKYLLDLE